MNINHARGNYCKLHKRKRKTVWETRAQQASGKKGHLTRDVSFTFHSSLARKGFHTYFKRRKLKLREIKWLGQGHTAWKWQSLKWMTPRNTLSVLVTGFLRLGLRKIKDWCGWKGEVSSPERSSEGKAGRRPGALHFGEMTDKRWGRSGVSMLCILNRGVSAS